MNDLYSGYIPLSGKKPPKGYTFKNKRPSELLSLEEAKKNTGYGGVLANDTVLVDIDDWEQSEIMMNIVEHCQLNCRVYQTSRGRHFVFKNHQISRNRTHVPLAIGVIADIKCGSRTSYEVIKIDGEERFIEWDIESGEQYQEIPKWMMPVSQAADFVDMVAGDGRNQALFNYILTLTGAGFVKEEARECIRLLNKFVLKSPLEESELEVVLRDEAFQKPVFFDDKTFLFDQFAQYMCTNHHVVLINDQLHIYRDGVYVDDRKAIEAAMIQTIPMLRKAQRREALDYMELIAERKTVADARYIAFRNGVYDLVEDKLIDFDSEKVLTNKIPWDYVPGTYDELCDETLNKIACQDKEIRMLLEECIGYCMYRHSELGKAFILTGDKSNGKSTFLDMVKSMLGEYNVSSLDLKELGDRFSTAMMFGKLANIGDDIGDDFLQGTQVSVFKKVVTGNRIKAERKGLDPFDFNPYVKLLFSANDIPRMKDKTGAVLRRLVIIPFNASFSKDDPDFDPEIKYKLIEQSSMEYMILIGLEGLKRVRINNGFTTSNKVEKEIAAYKEENNPILAFIADQEAQELKIENEPTNEVYKRYQVFCADNSMTPMSNIVFSKQINRELGLTVSVVRLDGKIRRLFVKERKD